MDINTVNEQFEAAKEVSKVGMLTSLKLAQATGIPQSIVVIATGTACLATLIASGANDETIGKMVEAAKEAAARVKEATGGLTGDASDLAGMVPAGNA